MTNGFKHDTILASNSANLKGEIDFAATGPGTHAAPKQLVLELPGHPALQDDAAGPKHPLEQAHAQPAKPTRSLVGRLVVTPIRNIVSALVMTKVAVLSYQPTPRHIALLLMVTILLIVPWFISSLLAIALGTVAVTYLVVGHDFSCKIVASWFNWLKRRDSQGAELVRARAERVSICLTRWLDRLPANWTSGLYLPDFAYAEDFSEKLQSDPFGRLKGETQNQ